MSSNGVGRGTAGTSTECEEGHESIDDDETTLSTYTKNSMNFKVHDRLQELETVVGSEVLSNGEEFHMESILEEMIDERRWGDGSDINEHSFGISDTNKGHPCGYTESQVI